MESVCVFGDSITRGARDYYQGGWVTRLKNYFAFHNYGILFYNCGISGDNSNDLLDRIEPEIQSREADVVVFAIGINDSQYVNSEDNPRIGIEEFQNNLQELVDKALAFSEKVVFVGITNVDESKTMPIPWNKNKFYKNEKIEKYNEKIKEICQRNNIYFLDMFDLLKSGDLEDGLHPNFRGHKKIFEKVRDFLILNRVCGKSLRFI